jgi:flagellar biosynthesis protein FlhB
MSRPIKNPFYWLLLTACAALLVTILVYLVGWAFWSNTVESMETGAQDPLPAWMRWVDQRALALISVEVAAIIVLSGLTIGLDRFFDSINSEGEK